MNDFSGFNPNATFGDTFFEQIVAVRRTPKQIMSLVGIAFGFVALLGLAFFVTVYIFPPVGALLAIGSFWAAYRLVGLSSVEYEYIYTNGDLDIDKITAKSARKRMVSIKCSSIERFSDYNPAVRPSTSVKKVYTLCDPTDERAVYFIAPHKQEGLVMVIFAPDERIKGVVLKSVPRTAR